MASSFLSNKALQIAIAILIPNLSSWITYAVLIEKVKENAQKDQIQPIYAPPGYVRFFYDLENLIS